MKRNVRVQLGQMLTWQSRMQIPLVLLLLLGVIQLELRAELPVASAVWFVWLGATLAVGTVATVCGILSLWYIYHTALLAFGQRAAIIYSLMALVLLFWIGVLVISQMLRLDVKWDRDIVPPGEEQPVDGEPN